MSKNNVCSLVLVFVLMGVFGLAIRVQRVEASGTIYIRTDGSVEGTTYIESNNNVTYVFTAEINDSVVVQRNNTIIDGNGYTLKGSGVIGSVGFELTSVSNVTITRTNVSRFDTGIHLALASNNTISGNSITNNGYGIVLSRSSNNAIIGDIFVNDGLRVIDSYGNVVEDNSVNGKPLVYLEGVSNLAVSCDAGQVILVDCDRILVENLNLSHTAVGIQLCKTCNTKITNNSIANSRAGIELWSSSNNNTVLENNITNNLGGIGIDSSSYSNTVIENNITNNSMGMELFGSNNTVAGNIIATSNYYGIEVCASSNNIISGNNVAHNCYGIVLSRSSNNAIIGNDLTHNDNGFLLYYSSTNKIHHNNFLNNTIQACANNSTDFWDDSYPSGGNYWSNYTGSDLQSGSYQNETGNDGIIDTAMTIDENNTDRYPLAGLFYDFKVTPDLYVRSICNSLISDFQYNGTAIKFNASGENGTTGFCRILIPTALMNVTYRVFVNGTEVSYRLLPFSNETYSYLYFNYTHSIQEVIIIPEFPSFIIILLLIIASSLAALACKESVLSIPEVRKKGKCGRHLHLFTTLKFKVVLLLTGYIRSEEKPINSLDFGRYLHLEIGKKFIRKLICFI